VTADTELQAPVFEVERFALDGDRLELEGHWSGVRGMRFMRPTLTLLAGDERRRLLASLDGKPWAPDDESWTAAFPWDGGDLVAEGAELAVGPALVVDLPAPEGAAAPRARASGSGRFTAAASQSRDALVSSRDAASAERDTLRHELAAAVAERDRLRAEVESAQGAGAAGEQAAKRALTEAAAERDELQRTLAAMQAERDEARAALDVARQERDAAQQERDAAQRAAKAAEKGRGEARRAAAKLQEERDELARQRDDAERDRDDARRAVTSTAGNADDDSARLRRALAVAEAQRDAARHELEDASPATVDALRRERDAAVAARDEALRAARARLVAPVPATAPVGVRTQSDHPSVTDSLLIRATATISVIVVLIVAYLLLT
jgi:hypothetical protein